MMCWFFAVILIKLVIPILASNDPHSSLSSNFVGCSFSHFEDSTVCTVDACNGYITGMWDVAMALNFIAPMHKPQGVKWPDG